MPGYPSSLALTSIADGSLIVAADHRNNYVAIQTGFNGLLTTFAVTTKGDLLVATGANAVAPLAVGANNLILQADSTQSSGMKWAGTYTAYTPTWASSGVAPVIGNAVVLSHYLQLGKLVHFYGQLTFGTTSTFGTGNYTFSLPAAAATLSGIQRGVGTSWLFDTSAAAVAGGLVNIPSSGSFGFEFGATYLGTRTDVGAVAPWTWAIGDAIHWNFTYEAA